MAVEPDFALQKSEIAFFMEKTFQISFTYFGGLVAFFALSKTAVTSAVVKATGIPLGILAALVILLLNLLYITLACACIFAILKRGMFILKHSPRSPGSEEPLHIEWEKFVRDNSMMPDRYRLRSLAWNIDNYYMIPLYALIVFSSLSGALYALADGPLQAQIAAGVLVFFYIVPAYMFYYTAVMNHESRELLDARNVVEQQPSVAGEVEQPSVAEETADLLTSACEHVETSVRTWRRHSPRPARAQTAQKQHAWLLELDGLPSRPPPPESVFLRAPYGRRLPRCDGLTFRAPTPTSLKPGTRKGPDPRRRSSRGSGPQNRPARPATADAACPVNDLLELWSQPHMPSRSRNDLHPHGQTRPG